MQADNKKVHFLDCYSDSVDKIYFPFKHISVRIVLT